MPTVYTKIAKPTTTYTPVFGVGKESYDDAAFTYDDATLAYDGSVTTYTKVSKPVQEISKWSDFGALTWLGLGSKTWNGLSTWTRVPKAT